MEFGNGFTTIGAAANADDHRKMLMYFDRLKSSNEGLEYSVTELLNNEFKENQEEMIFLHWKVLEFHIQNRHEELPPEVILGLRKALMSWLQKQSNELKSMPLYLRNKAAQVFALLFAKEFLSSWPSMMLDVMKVCLNKTNTGVDFYLRMLLAIDVEVVDRTIMHSEIEQAHNQNIKDTMRETCIPAMVESWYNLLLLCTQNPNPNIASMCLDVVGAYIEWIDINMIANEKFLPLIFMFMGVNVDSEVRESACDCLREIAIKGMLPLDKIRLIEVLWPEIKPYCQVQDKDDVDYLIKLSKLIGGIGSALITAWVKYIKLENISDIAKSSPNVQQNYISLVTAAEDKAPFCFQFVGHEDDDVSQQCVQFALDYIDMLKKIKNMNGSQKQNIVVLFNTLAKKFKYDSEYCFENEGEEEAEFKEYLKGLKNIYENLIQLDPDLVQSKVRELLAETLGKWQYLEFSDVEVCIRLLYLLGESLAVNLGSQFTNDAGSKTPLHDMLTILTSSGVCDHPHPYVRLMYFETVVRYDRFLILQGTNENVLLGVMQAFLDERGVKSTNPAIRSRCSYLLSRFVKTTCKSLQSFTEKLLTQIESLLMTRHDESGQIFSPDDKLFVYELAGTLIVNSSLDGKTKNALMTSLLSPLVEGFNPSLNKMHEVYKMETESGSTHFSSEQLANDINYSMSYASRTSKAFSNKHTMAQAGCSDVYTETLRIFLSGFDVEVYHDIIHSGIRQYLHRMVICLEEEVLPFIPIAVQNLLKHCNARALHQFIPLINQIVNKFKKSISPFLAEIFMPVVRTVFQILSEEQGELSEDAKTVRRTYFQFIHAIVSNNLAEVILKQENSDAEMVLLTIKQGAVDFPDPTAQKVCFNIFHKLVASWKTTQNGALREFIIQIIVPACFQAPTQPTFDFSDGQTILVLKETSSIMKDLYGILGIELIQALKLYLPNLELSESVADEYCQALAQLDKKQFRNYTKAFFQRGRC
uniref:LOW QUALITY PROTEIN: exportin-T-like n=1 Tax=Styela clava TaxID=7725 RepID=UPI00193A9474|nr:LOW QUALITY PROTEIN: exportin-T-like [Styela clava]